VTIRFAFIGAGNEENLSIRYLASAVEKAGYKSRIIACSNESEFNKVIKKVSNFKPQVIGISIAFQSLSDTYFKLIGELRKNGFIDHIIIGGHFPTFDYKQILESYQSIDSVCRFEGETTVIELGEHIEEKRGLDEVVNLVYRSEDGLHMNHVSGCFPDLDNLAFPKRDETDQVRLGEHFATLVTSRGCWHSSCLYCSIGAFHREKSSKFALRSPDNIASELGSLYNKGYRLFQFHDDNFMLDNKRKTISRVGELKKSFLKEGIRIEDTAFLIKARPDVVDKNVADTLSDLGVVGAFLGVENASQTGLKSLIRNASPDDIHDAIDSLRSNDISVTYNLLIFHPDAVMEEIDDNISFIKENLDNPFDFGRAEVVAGSPLESKLKKEDRLLGVWPHWNYEIKDEVVERMFKINHLCFRHPESGYSRLAQSTIALSYQAHTMRRLHQGRISEKYYKKSEKQIIKTNRFILKALVRLYDLASSRIDEDDVDEFRQDIHDSCRNLTVDTEGLSHKLRRIQTADKIFSKLNVRENLHENRIIEALLGF